MNATSGSGKNLTALQALSELPLPPLCPFRPSATALAPFPTDLVMGIMVQSSELKEITDSQHLEELIQNNPIYYAEVRFQGEL